MGKESNELFKGFYNNEAFATKLLQQAACTVEKSSRGLPHTDDSLGKLKNARTLIRGQHGPACGPQCYCLKFQDTPLTADYSKNELVWEESFHDKAKAAGTAMMGSVHAATSN